MVILQAKNLRKVYGSGESEVAALDGVNLSVEKGEFLAVVGTSGSGKSTLLNLLGGKSTLLHIIAGVDVPTSGSVVMDGKQLELLSDDELTIFRRRKIGFVFQQFNLIPMLNVWENIILPLKLDNKRVDKKYIRDIIDILGLEKKCDSLPGQLSGGQQQRVSIARAMAIKPSVILADEPTGNLDSRTSQDVLGILKVTSEQYRQTMVMITHNAEIAQMADRIVRIEDGKIVM